MTTTSSLTDPDGTGWTDSEGVMYDLDAERYVLSSMMQHPAAIEAAAEVLEARHFYRPAHRVLFNAMVMMFAADIAIDPVTLKKWLEENGELKQATGQIGPVYLVDIYELRALPAN